MQLQTKGGGVGWGGVGTKKKKEKEKKGGKNKNKKILSLIKKCNKFSEKYVASFDLKKQI